MPVDMTQVVAKYQQLQQQMGDVPYLELKEGLNVVRFLPPPPGSSDFYREFKQAFAVGPNGKSVVPPGQYGKPCALQEHIDALLRMGDELSKKEAEKMKSKNRVAFAVIDRSDPQAKPVCFTTNQGVFRDILGIMADPDYDNITDPLTGSDVTIEYNKKTANGFPEWKVRAKRNRSALGTEEQINQWTNVDWLTAWKIGEPTDNAYIKACLAGTEKNFKRDSASVGDAASVSHGDTSFDPQQFVNQPIIEQPVQPQTVPAQNRQFYITLPDNSVAPISEADLRANYVEAGHTSIPTVLQGEQVWQTPGYYGIHPTPKQPVAPAAPVAPAIPAAPAAPVAPAAPSPVAMPQPTPVAPSLPPATLVVTAAPVAAPVIAPVPTPTAVPASPPFDPNAYPGYGQPQPMPAGGPPAFPRPAAPMPTPTPAPGQSQASADIRNLLAAK